MDPVPAPPPWIPEDDLLLKNSLEAGASLESLAKGAVRFSQKYSYAELRDRWHSLLYDPVISAECAAKMVSLELSGGGLGAPSPKPGGSGSKEALGEGAATSKRKSESIRKQYYATKKKFRRQILLDTFDMNVQDEMNVDNNVADEGLVRNSVEGGKVVENVGVGLGEFVNGVSLVGCKLNKNVDHVNNLVGYGNSPGLEEVGQSHLMGDVPLWNAIEDVALPAMPVQDDLEGNCANDVLKASDSLLDENELIFMDVEVKGAKDKPCYASVDPLMLSSPFEIQGNDASQIVANPLGGNHGELHSASNAGNDAEASVAGQSPHPELSGRFITCRFNTEDPDVPHNDVSVVAPHSLTLKSQPLVKEVGPSDSSINNQRKDEPDGSSKKEDIPSHSFATSKIVKPGLVPNINSIHRPVDVVEKPDLPLRNPISAVSGPSHSRLVHATMMPPLDGCSEQEKIDAPASAKVYVHPKAGEHKGLHKSEAKPLLLDPEGDDDDLGSEDEDDDDIPHFSDVEAMILEMDLRPSDQDSNANGEVSRYQHEETKRTIIRLEQSAKSSMHRAIASHDALAVLYGNNLTEYIRTNEVILGRGTDEMAVDIDLGREGNASKISRRQALIKMEANGSFIIKNLGKCSIFLNGKEVATGQARGLSASSLIEIRGMSFIFDFITNA
ncbi:hypothetical protein RIF29_33467 [Crotalaria pallida]|uniref:FHA domain-containing protein n=1 Tax=Crotalaria pallida TaxID=3830 RepID=A0AAN9HST4_CROPI